MPISANILMSLLANEPWHYGIGEGWTGAETETRPGKLQEVVLINVWLISRGVSSKMNLTHRWPISYRPSEAARVLGISLSHLDRMTKAGEIPFARIGRLRVYSDDALRRWIQEKTEENSRKEQKK